MILRFQSEVMIPVGKITLLGELIIPQHVKGIIIFSHGSGSSRLSKRNKAVAKYLQENNFGTLLFDLLTAEEEWGFNNRFNIDLLAKRLVDVTKWVESQPETKDCHVGYFGASTGAAAALVAAAELPEIQAVVSRGGRPDLAMQYLPQVNAPTLLIVGSLDQEVLQMNREAYMRLKCKKQLEIVEGATHLFEEPGRLEIVSELAGKWFEKYISVPIDG